jgi:arylsulfatase A-like enzyme
MFGCMPLVLMLLAGPLGAERAGGRTPNIVLILVDDLGWADLGCYGSKFHETPNIDALARQGVRFSQGYASCAVCSPTRAALLTGRHPARIGITDWIHYGKNERRAEQLGRLLDGYVGTRSRRLLTPINGAFLPHEEVTLAEMLKPLGYVSCHIGKWHLGGSGWGSKSWLPTDQGFDYNLGGTRYGAPGSYYDPFPQKPAFPRTSFPARKAGQYLTDREADEAVRFIRENKDRPFFLYMAHYAVHSPIQPKRQLLEKYLKKPKTTKQRCPAYATMVESVDQAVGRILAVLDELALADRTIVIFTSDNGGASHVRCPGGGPATDNSPLRLGKGFPYEGGIRVPFIFRWPGRIPAGEVCDTPIISHDLVPTLCAATGAELPHDRAIDGVNLLPLLTRSGTLQPRTLYWHFPHYWWGTNVRPYSIIRDGDWKLIRHYETGEVELYNLASDLGETRDLAASEPERACGLEAKLDRWLESVNAKLPKANPDFKGPAANKRRPAR